MKRLIATLCVAISGTAAAAACNELPVLFVVQDKSGSMLKDPTGAVATTASPSKWSSAQSVVPALATQFTNRFRFGAMMFPTETSQFNCSTGSLATAVSSDPRTIATAYGAAAPGGGTSTAATLLAAKDYLLGLHLTTPAYVLLITDGLPNCNLSLNPNTCTASTPGCANDACKLGAKDCIDDQGTDAAAAALLAANIKVFVVGFDSTLTSGNNLSVLNGIAAAGGTTSAYTASNKAQLAATLSTIALNTATCCKDACTTGATQCGSDGTAQTCAFDAAVGCTVWNSKACGASQSCVNGSCSNTCTDACKEGALQCVGQDAQQCVKGSNGCTAWSAGTTCDSGQGQTCVDGACKTSCTDACEDGARQCSATGPQVCVKLTACTAWQDLANCDSKSMCVDGACLPLCNGELSSCQVGTVCSEVSGGKACVPGAGSGGTKADAGVGGLKDIKAGAGCGCQSVDASLPLFAAALTAMWGARRRRSKKV